MSLHPHAAGLFMIDDPAWRRKLWRAGWTMLLPVVGWYMVLGYRSALVRRLLEGTRELPEWSGGTWRYFVDGMKAALVILAYLSPLYAASSALAWSRGWVPSSLDTLVFGFFLAFPFLMPVSLPCALLRWAWSEFVSPLECTIILVLFAATVFVIPAGFLQVSRTTRFCSALSLGSVARFLRARGEEYARAWLSCTPMAIAGHLVLPIAPWSVVWAYFGAMFLFNEVLVGDESVSECSWIARVRTDPRWESTRARTDRTLVDGGGALVPILRIANFSAPLPWPVARGEA